LRCYGIFESFIKYEDFSYGVNIIFGNQFCGVTLKNDAIFFGDTRCQESISIDSMGSYLLFRDLEYWKVEN